MRDASAVTDGLTTDSAPDAPPFVCAAPGSPDLGFGASGVVNAVFGLGGRAGATSVAVDPVTSRIVIGGYASRAGNSAFAVVRLLSNGVLDPSFGSAGVALVGLPASDCFVNDIALQSDGKIVAVGGVNDDQRARLGILRLNADGSRDATFGVNGLIVTEPAAVSQGTGVDIDAKSRILISASTYDGVGVLDESRFTTIRLLPSGLPDASFGIGGVAENAFDNGQDVAYDILAQPDGRIVVAGAVASINASTIPKLGIARYLESGELDTSFGSGGLATVGLPGGAAAYGVALDASEQALLVGEAAPQGGAISRFMPSGAIDLTFGQTGTTTVPMPPGLANAVVAENGAIIAVGYEGLVRVLANGAVDVSFGTSGVVSPGSIHDLEHDVALQGDQRIVVVGSRMVGSAGVYKSDFFAARYCP